MGEARRPSRESAAILACDTRRIRTERHDNAACEENPQHVPNRHRANAEVPIARCRAEHA